MVLQEGALRHVGGGREVRLQARLVLRPLPNLRAPPHLHLQAPAGIFIEQFGKHRRLFQAQTHGRTKTQTHPPKNPPKNSEELAEEHRRTPKNTEELKSHRTQPSNPSGVHRQAPPFRLPVGGGAAEAQREAAAAARDGPLRFARQVELPAGDDLVHPLHPTCCSTREHKTKESRGKRGRALANPTVISTVGQSLAAYSTQQAGAANTNDPSVRQRRLRIKFEARGGQGE